MIFGEIRGGIFSRTSTHARNLQFLDCSVVDRAYFGDGRGGSTQEELYMKLTSQAFTDGGAIPDKYTKYGENRIPPLHLEDIPERARSLALIVDDPDAPIAEPWVHWILVNIPGSLTTLPAGFHELDLPADAPAGITQGKNTWGTIGYRGPAPPKGHGPHHYHFKLYALDAKLDIVTGVEKHDLLEMLSGHIVARGELVGTYRRD